MRRLPCPTATVAEKSGIREAVAILPVVPAITHVFIGLAQLCGARYR